jgi:hypothetical protein
MAKLPDFLRVLGVAAPPGLDVDSEAVSALDHDRFRVFSPGDICPDNHLLTREGLRPGELPAMAAVFRGLLALTEQWSVGDLPRYPAFSG